MKLVHLALRNFRCFEFLELELDPAMTVLVGENASGKTAVLEGLSIGLSTLFRAWPQAPQNPLRIRPEAARIERIQNNGHFDLYPHFPAGILCEGSFEDHGYAWSRDLFSIRGNTQTTADDLLETMRARGAEVVGGGSARLPLLAYFGTQRLWLQKKDTAPKRAIPNRFAGYLDCLDPVSNHKHWRDWLFHQTLAELQDGVASPLLAAVQNAIRTAIDGAERFYFDVKNEELQIVWKGSRRAQPFDELSDGWRNLVGMFADLAWRAAVLNPDDGADAAARATGVVLVDEVDLHLHPAWQGEVLAALRRAFPKLQFVVSTHSPRVVGSSEAAWIRILDGTSTVGRVQRAFGRDANDVLRNIMGAPTRDTGVAKLLDSIEVAIEGRKWQAAAKKIERLAEILGSDHADVVRANWSLRLERGDD